MLPLSLPPQLIGAKGKQWVFTGIALVNKRWSTERAARQTLAFLMSSTEKWADSTRLSAHQAEYFTQKHLISLQLHFFSGIMTFREVKCAPEMAAGWAGGNLPSPVQWVRATYTIANATQTISSITVLTRLIKSSRLSSLPVLHSFALWMCVIRSAFCFSGESCRGWVDVSAQLWQDT